MPPTSALTYAGIGPQMFKKVSAKFDPLRLSGLWFLLEPLMGFRMPMQSVLALQESSRQCWMALDMREGRDRSLPFSSILRSVAIRRALADRLLFARWTKIFGSKAQLWRVSRLLNICVLLKQAAVQFCVPSLWRQAFGNRVMAPLGSSSLNSYLPLRASCRPKIVLFSKVVKFIGVMLAMFKGGAGLSAEHDS